MDIDRIQARYLLEAGEPPADLPVTLGSGYVHYTAFAYLVAGPDEYRKFDALGLPPEAWGDVRLDQLRRGCEQIVAWKGFTRDAPLEGIGIGGFYRLLHLFHFELAVQSALPGPDDAIVDEMRVRHVVDGREVTLYNLVPNPFAPKPPGPPCPHCGAPLRTARARQCRACGADWHSAPPGSGFPDGSGQQ